MRGAGGGRAAAGRPPPGGGRGSGRLAVAALAVALVTGALVRLALLTAPHLWQDEATVGLMGLAVLRGELPVYFYGQPFMGALDAYLAAPLYALVGVSPTTLKLTAVLLALTWLGLTVGLAGAAFGRPAAAWAALMLAVPGDLLLRWSADGRTQYLLGMVLGTLAILLAWRAPGSPTRVPLCFALTGLVVGLAFWTTFLTVVFLPAVALLLVRRGTRPVLRGAPWAVTAAVLGSLPHWLYGLAHGTAIPTGGLEARGLAAHAAEFVRTAWPVVVGLPGPLVSHPVGRTLAAALTAALLVAAGGALRASRRGAPGRGWMTGAAGLVVLVNVALALGTVYARNLGDYDQRYFLPLYTAGPVLAGAGLAALPAGLAAVTGATLVAGQAIGAGYGVLGRLGPAGDAVRQELRLQTSTVEALAEAGMEALYSPDRAARVLTFLSAERVIASHHYEETMPRHARLVDGTPGAAWWLPGPSAVVEANLAALGIRAAYRPISPLGGVYTAFALDEPPLRRLESHAFRVTASDRGDLAPLAVDGDVATAWGLPGPRRGGEWLAVDLGAPVPVALLRWLPGTYQEVPGGFTLDVSLDGRTWRRALDVPEYLGPLYWSADRPMARVRGGRVELRLPGTVARHLRVTQRGTSPTWGWSIRELWVYAAEPRPTSGLASPRGADVPGPGGTALAAAVREAGVRRLAADHGWAARVALADPSVRVPPADLYLDSYGWQGDPGDLWPALDWQPGTGLLVGAADAGPSIRLLADSGHAARSRTLGPLVLLTHAAPDGGRPLPSRDFRVTVSRQPERAGLMVDGRPLTRWSTGGPRAPGDWVRVDLGTARRLRALLLATADPAAAPPGLAAEGSVDGEQWTVLAARVSPQGSLRWAGFTPVRQGLGGVRVELGGSFLRAVRLALTTGDPVHAWSIDELAVLAD